MLEDMYLEVDLVQVALTFEEKGVPQLENSIFLQKSRDQGGQTAKEGERLTQPRVIFDR